MSGALTWLFAFVGGYIVYTLYWGVTSGRAVTSPSGFFLASGGVAPWVFVLSATALCLSGWMFAGYPALLFAHGLPAGQLALTSVATALTGALFLKRQWLIGRRDGCTTQGQMLSAYYQGEAIRVLGVLIALLFAIGFAGQQLAFGGRLIALLTRGSVDPDAAMWILGFALFLYVCFGGMRAVTAVGALQGMLVVAGIVVVGCLAYLRLGGFATLQEALAKVATSGAAPDAQTWFNIPGVVQFTAGLGREEPVGGPWTAAMISSTALALMGLQATPAFTQLALSCRDIRGFAPQQVWAGAGVTGLVLLFFGLAQGLGAHFLGASPALNDAGLALGNALPVLQPGTDMDLLPSWLDSLSAGAPWFMALLAVCALAATQVAVAAYAAGCATSLSVDVFRRFMVPDVGDRALLLAARLCVCALVLAALLLASFAPPALNLTGSLALSAAAQLLPALAGLCWWRWITRQGATLGLYAGLIAVLLTEPLGGVITTALGFELPWDRWPWTIHSAGWGLFFNLLFCALVSFATRGGEAHEHRAAHHDFLVDHGGASAPRRLQRPAVWALTLVWFFFGLGPGTVIGNDVFGAPGAGLTGWLLGVPSLWAWQVLWWALGVLSIWWLAYKMELATLPRKAVESAHAAQPGAVPAPQWVRNFLRRVT